MHQDNPQAATPRPKPEMSVKERQAAAARATLVEATISCLDKFGYAATSINRIQEAAGVSRGALTHHFPNKEDLMVATLDRLLISTLHTRPYQAKTTAVRRDWLRTFNLSHGVCLDPKMGVRSRRFCSLCALIQTSMSELRLD